MLNLDVMPSMRALMTAGPALERDNVCAYNCSYLPIASTRAFDECLYILMVRRAITSDCILRLTNQMPSHQNILSG